MVAVQEVWLVEVGSQPADDCAFFYGNDDDDDDDDDNNNNNNNNHLETGLFIHKKSYQQLKRVELISDRIYWYYYSECTCTN